MTRDTERSEKIERLKRISLFGELAADDNAMGQIADLFGVVSLAAGRNVIQEGQEGDELYVIKSGTVDIVKKTMQGDPYTVTALSADMNVFFGEMALLDSDKRSATVSCKTDCAFYVLKRADFLKLGEVNCAASLVITRELCRILCGRLRKMNADVITLFDALVGEVEESGGIAE
ncbi:MAG: cyclic nucleotide-binding domain-containing protein [Chitinivibrionales bacterium]|nr:cyclic nucleotide-binding domain-containing protein [Chitinivibrionales bacterium]MBD3395741.1 cyclic nucleotide-binding domain-containing protein [Chitinivibrionales bacterium]